MNILWGIIMCAIGLYLLLSAIFKHEKFIYKFLAAKSSLLWGKKVHIFYIFVGIILIIIGILWATGIIWV